MSTPHFFTIPLADKGFISTHPLTNPVRWFVEDVRDSKLLGPFTTPQQADELAAHLNGLAR